MLIYCLCRLRLCCTVIIMWHMIWFIYLLCDLSALCMLWHPLYNVWSWFVYHFSFPPRHTFLLHTHACTHIHTVLLISSLETPINELWTVNPDWTSVFSPTPPFGLKPAILNSNFFSGVLICYVMAIVARCLVLRISVPSLTLLFSASYNKKDLTWLETWLPGEI